jgi:8-amino-7-oxononanoate synthase
MLQDKCEKNALIETSMFTRELKNIRHQGLYRERKWLDSPQGEKIVIDGKKVLNFSSNDYLGLANRPELIECAIKSLKNNGMSMASSRLLSGSHRIHRELEERIASFKLTEDALVFSSGYTANIGVIAALIGRDDAAFCDKLNHASIIDGLRLSGASLYFYRHKDMNHLEIFLKKDVRGKKLIVTESVFSMDGDIAPLDDIISLADTYGAMVLIDDAHGFGVLGASGRGCTEYFGLQGRDDLIMIGTLSKAVGCTGGFVAGKGELIEYIINKARSFIFTTALPLPVAKAATEAINIIESKPELRKKLWQNSESLREGFKSLGLNTMDSQTPIIPIMTGDIDKAISFSSFFYNNRVYVPPIRPPTVPPEKCRLRFSVSALHNTEDIKKALTLIQDLLLNEDD